MTKKVFQEENIILNAKFVDKWAAIRACGQILVDNAYVKEEYVEDMIEREKSSCVYIGNNVAIPHGLLESGDKIINSGISFLQIPDGVSFGDEKAYMLIGIAGKGDDHINMLGSIAMACSDMGNIDKLRTTSDKNEICKILTEINRN